MASQNATNPDGSSVTRSAQARVRCREIAPPDLDELVALLHRGFPERSPANLALSLDRLAKHATPAGFPRYGYVLEANGKLVGAILVIFSSVVVDGTLGVRGNVASWYTDAEYRSYASLLTSHALARKDVTFLNLTPAPHTWPILEAQGYKRWSSGVFAAVPCLSPGARRVTVREFSSDIEAGQGLSPLDVQLLSDHASYGCTSVVCVENDLMSPFIFGPRRWTRWKSIPLPYAVLAYSRGVEQFVRFAGPLGRFLARRKNLLVFVDANGAIPGLHGRYLEWGPKFYRGPNPPPLGDVAYTERVMFNM